MFKVKHGLAAICMMLALTVSFTTTCEAYMYWFTSKGEERRIGDQYAAEIEGANQVIQGHKYNEVIDEVTNNIVKTIEWPRYDYKVKLLDDGHFNAYSVPGGHIYVTYKLMKTVKTYDIAAFVVGHELGHDMNEHWMQTVERMYKAEILTFIIGKKLKLKDNEMAWALTATYVCVSRGYGFDKEHQADRYGFDRLAAAGYNVGAGAMFFHTLKKMERPQASTDIGTEIANYLNPHPKTETRLQRQLQYMKEYSGNRVEVKGNAIYIDGKYLMSPQQTLKYDSYERAIYIAGNIARRYHEDKVVTWWVSPEGKLMANDEVIFTPQEKDESADEVLARVKG